LKKEEHCKKRGAPSKIQRCQKETRGRGEVILPRGKEQGRLREKNEENKKKAKGRVQTGRARKKKTLVRGKGARNRKGGPMGGKGPKHGGVKKKKNPR